MCNIHSTDAAASYECDAEDARPVSEKTLHTHAPEKDVTRNYIMFSMWRVCVCTRVFFSRIRYTHTHACAFKTYTRPSHFYIIYLYIIFFFIFLRVVILPCVIIFNMIVVVPARARVIIYARSVVLKCPRRSLIYTARTVPDDTMTGAAATRKFPTTRCAPNPACSRPSSPPAIARRHYIHECARRIYTRMYTILLYVYYYAIHTRW